MYLHSLLIPNIKRHCIQSTDTSGLVVPRKRTVSVLGGWSEALQFTDLFCAFFNIVPL